MKLLHIGCDVDEVCADFTGGFIKAANEVLGLNLPDEPWSDWQIDKALGISREQELLVWAHILEGPDFNENLAECKRNPGFTRYLNQLYEARKAQVTFLTARAEHSTGHPVQRRTAIWFERNGFPNAPVIVSHNKGPIAKALGFDAFIDDKFQNCAEVKAHVPECHVFMPVYPYNEQYVEQATAAGIMPVHTAFDALTWLERLDTTNG
jgi:5'(3')-deoxyribonucleotidase